MNTSLVIEQYPVWYISLCLLLGLAYAAFLYFKDNTFKEATKGQKRWILPISILRFLAVSTLAFLLLSPLIKNQFTDTIPPYVIMVHDNSESVASAFTSSDSTTYASNMQSLQAKLSNNYKVASYSFGQDLSKDLSFTFDNKVTNLSKNLNELYDTYNNQNVGAIILATDGIYNQGSNPAYLNSSLNVPIYAIALGDTTLKRDLVLEKVLHNRIAYLGDKFTVRADITAKNSSASNTILNVYKGKGRSNKVYTKKININSNDFIATEEVILDADAPGVQQYTITLNEINNELTTENNSQTIFVEVLDSRQKILLLAASPHPDLSAIKQSIENNKNYEVNTAYINKFKGSPKDYNLAILHGLPSSPTNSNSLIEQLKKDDIPVWFIVSSQTDIRTFNNAQSVVSINGNNRSPNDAKAEIQSSFNLFTIEGSYITGLQALPPLQTPFGKYRLSPSAQILMKQKIGTVSTDYPLLAVEQATGYKIAVLCGEGLWRWRLYNYKQSKTYDAFDEMVSKIVQYLSVKNDKRKFRVNMPKTLFNENETITFNAELYNDSYELINTPDVNLSIFDQDKNAYPFTFSKTDNAYALNAGFFPVGNYTYQAQTVFNGQEYKANGSFSVAPIQLESLQTTANHQLLYQLTKQSGGQVIYPDSIANIASILQAQPNIKPQLYTSYQTQSLINLKWIFFVLLGFLSIEWFVRKLIGGY